MMTVRELIDELKNYDENMTVIIGEIQDYGSNWAYNIPEVSELSYDDFDSEEGDEACVVITQGRQIGTVNFY